MPGRCEVAPRLIRFAGQLDLRFRSGPTFIDDERRGTVKRLAYFGPCRGELLALAAAAIAGNQFWPSSLISFH